MNTARIHMRCALAACLALSAAPAAAQEQLFFPSHQDVRQIVISRINAETVRLDIATWYLTERAISNAIINRHNAGVTVRIIGDRVSIFEIDALTRREFEYLAANGVPIRLRYHPTTFPYIMHWKAGIFVGQQVVEFGSANWTPFELAPVSSSNFKDETAMFSDDPSLVSAFRSRFDQFWADTSDFLDWPVAYEREMGQPWPTPMTIDRRRLEPDVSGPSTMIWEQGPALNNRMASAIQSETQGADLVVYRLSNSGITNALLNRLSSGVPVRMFIEPSQYRESSWPEYWLTGARVDQLWAAGARIKERVHDGLTHMKVLITSRDAMHGSSNFTNNWQRDQNYFIPAATKPALYNTLRDEFERMWNARGHYRDFYPDPPAVPTLVAPADTATGLSSRPRLEWNRTPWAVAFDLYLGTSLESLTFQGRIGAVLTESPPTTYSWTPGTALRSHTQYFWRVVARTFATDLDPSLVAMSAVRTFVTDGSGPPPGSNPQVDLVLQHETSGQLALWTMNGTTVDEQLILPQAADPSWRLAAYADMDRDGSRDLIFQHRSTGGMLVWLLSGRAFRQQIWLSPSHVADPDWRIVAAGDHDRDGRADLVFQHARDGRMLVWLMNGTALKTQEWLTPNGVTDPEWRIVGSGDVDANGTPDLIFQHGTTGGMVVWFMQGTTLMRQEWLTPDHALPEWRIAAVTNLTGGGNPDLVFQHRTDGRMLLWPMTGSRLAGGQLWFSPDRVNDPGWKIAAGR